VTLGLGDSWANRPIAPSLYRPIALGRSTDNPLLTRPTYRYHDLFTHFLRRQRKLERKEEVPELYLYAAQQASPKSGRTMWTAGC
jgi:hypothetical protein